MGTGRDFVAITSDGNLDVVRMGAGNDRVSIHGGDNSVDVVRCGPGEDRVDYSSTVDPEDQLIGCESVYEDVP
jgi:hypothetical protein